MDFIICFSLTASLITILNFSDKYININKLCYYNNSDDNDNNNNNKLDYDELQAVNDAIKKKYI